MRRRADTACAACGRVDDEEELHIGKSSGGWCFSLNVHPDQDIHDLADWERRWELPGSIIRDEYQEVISTKEMYSVITQRYGGSLPFPAGWMEMNSAEPGPNGLARHKVGNHCIGHGAGTWDLIPGQFT